MEAITKSGQRVVSLRFVPRNSVGELVTYPVKGSIVRRKKPLKLEYQIWSADGRQDVVAGARSGDDLAGVPAGLVWPTETKRGQT